LGTDGKGEEVEEIVGILGMKLKENVGGRRKLKGKMMEAWRNFGNWGKSMDVG
jgi:hypothetical protein